MNENTTLLPVLSALDRSGGATEIEVGQSQIDFVKNGCAWQVCAIGPGATYTFILLKEGNRILSFTNPESLTNFFKAFQNEEG